MQHRHHKGTAFSLIFYAFYPGNHTLARLADEKSLRVIRECCNFAPRSYQMQFPISRQDYIPSLQGLPEYSAFKVIELFDEGLFEFSSVVIPSSNSILLFHKYTFSHNPSHKKVFCILLQATKATCDGPH